MSGKRLHLALREIRGHLTDPRVLGGMAVVAVLLGVAGPFGSFKALPLVPRLAYWGAVVFTSYCFGFGVSRLVSRLIGLKVSERWARVLIFGSFTGLPVTLAVMAVNFVTFGSPSADIGMLWLQCTLIGLGVVTISEIVAASLAHAAAEPVKRDEQPALLERVPRPQRGPLVAISVADHYVEIFTVKGRALVLLRLTDAVREAAPTPGLRIHRSHWVALDAVVKTLRVNGKLFVELRDGRRLPVSRSYVDAVRNAGLMA